MSAVYDSTSRYQLDQSTQTATRRPIQKRFYTTYMVNSGDTLESLATRYLGDPMRYWELADLNPQIKFPLDIQPGDILRLPL